MLDGLAPSKGVILQIMLVLVGEVLAAVALIVFLYLSALKRRASAAELADWRQVMEHGPAGVARVDLDGRLAFVNRSFARLLGEEEPVQLLGSDWKARLDPADQEAIDEATGRLLSGTVLTQGRILAADRSVTYLNLTMFARFDSRKRLTGYYLVAIDVTAQRVAEQRLAQMAALERVEPLRKAAI